MSTQHNDTAKEAAFNEYRKADAASDPTDLYAFYKGFDAGYESAYRWTRVEGFRPADRQLIERARAILKHGTNGVVGEMEIAGAIEDLDELLHPNRFRPECIN